MRIIASTDALATGIKKAIDNNSSEFVVCDGWIIFSALNCLKISQLQRGEYRCKFHFETFIKLLSFLNHLELQPIVVEFREYAHTEVHEVPEIELSQFIKRFNQY